MMLREKGQEEGRTHPSPGRGATEAWGARDGPENVHMCAHVCIICLSVCACLCVSSITYMTAPTTFLL